MYGPKQANKIKNNGLLRRPNPSSSGLMAGGIVVALLGIGGALAWNAKKKADDEAKKKEEGGETTAEEAYGAPPGKQPKKIKGVIKGDMPGPGTGGGRPPKLNL